MAEAVESRQRKAVKLVAHEEHAPEPPVIERPPSDDQPDLTVGDSMGHFPDLCP